MKVCQKLVPAFCFMFLLGLFSFAEASNLLGRDADRDGLWDDVQQYIATTYPEGSERFQAAVQASLSMQFFMRNANSNLSAEEAKGNLVELGHGVQCFFYVHRMTAEKAIVELKEVVLGTPGRKATFETAEQLSQDIAVPVKEDPKTWWQDCDFPVRVLGNWPKN